MLPGGPSRLVSALVRRYRKKIRQPFDEITEEQWDKMMAVNVKGAWLCAKAVYPQMKKQNHRKIINMAPALFSTARRSLSTTAPQRGQSSPSPAPWPGNWGQTTYP